MEIVTARPFYSAGGRLFRTDRTIRPHLYYDESNRCRVLFTIAGNGNTRHPDTAQAGTHDSAAEDACNT
jgi:hypothetical protein